VREYLGDLIGTFAGFLTGMLTTLYVEMWLVPELPEQHDELKAIAASLPDLVLAKFLAAHIAGAFVGCLAGAWLMRARALRVAAFVGAILLLLNWGRFSGLELPGWVQADLVFGTSYVAGLAGWLMRQRRPAALTDV
jgi:hypothetical protein